MKLSIVIPVYNSAAAIERVVDDCFAALSHLDFELVLVNDGSADNTEEVLFDLARQHPNIKAISLAKNVGEFNAVMCGLNYATGEYVAIIDDDGQNPPREILKLLAEAEKGYDVVYAKYTHKKHSWWRNAGSWFSNLTATVLTGKRYDLYLSSFKVMKKELVQKIIAFKNPIVYPDVLVIKNALNIGTSEAFHSESDGLKSRYDIFKLAEVYASMVLTRFPFLGFIFFIIFVIATIGFVSFIIWLFESGAHQEVNKFIMEWIQIFGCVATVGLVISITLRIKPTEIQYEIKRTSFNA